ncbi:penicillin-binding protein, beta-lactamase class C [Burkholderiales bacterium JOSHI_001]|nr:penicillin-binding protein, beta-lactamase class C [Burkholderiales bacterium JOSHI_001]
MTLQSSLDGVLARAAASGNVPGVVGVVTDRQRHLYEGAFGQRVLGQGAAMTLDTVGWIASCTKAITGAACMQLVERGKLDLDSPAQQWAPRLAECQVLEGFDSRGQPKTRPPKRPITLRHLLTHTAGFGYEFWNAETARYQAATGTPGIISCTHAALMQPLLFDPGERWMYGVSIDWVGQLVQAASGQTLGAYLADHLFGPLGMRDTAFKLRPDMQARLAKIHQRDDSGALIPGDLVIEQSPEVEMAGGGLYGTVPDYLRFIRMMLNDGQGEFGRVLKPETVDRMCRNAMGDLRVTMLPTQAPPLTNDAEFFPGVPKSWGLSFQINEEPTSTGRPAGGLMWAGLSNCYYWFDRSHGIGGMTMTQVLPFADHLALPMFYEFESATYHSLR